MYKGTADVYAYHTTNTYTELPTSKLFAHVLQLFRKEGVAQ